MRGLTPQRRCVTFSLIPQLDATASRHYTDLISEECVARGTMTPEENDLLCRVEGNAPMGQIMRRHWIAACLSEEGAEPDGKPLRVKLLGENLVVFRDSKGRLGVLDEYCAHRRASLVYARNEGNGPRSPLSPLWVLFTNEK